MRELTIIKSMCKRRLDVTCNKRTTLIFHLNCVSISNLSVLKRFGSLIFFCFRLPHRFIDVETYFVGGSLLLKFIRRTCIHYQLFWMFFLSFSGDEISSLSQSSIVFATNVFCLFWLLALDLRDVCLHRYFSHSVFSTNFSYFHLYIYWIFI